MMHESRTFLQGTRRVNKDTKTEHRRQKELEDLVEKGKNNNSIGKGRAANSLPQVVKYKPPPPFPQHLVKKNRNSQFHKFLDIFKRLPINIPLVKTLEHMCKVFKRSIQ